MESIVHEVQKITIIREFVPEELSSHSKPYSIVRIHFHTTNNDWHEAFLVTAFAAPHVEITHKNETRKGYVEKDDSE